MALRRRMQAMAGSSRDWLPDIPPGRRPIDLIIDFLAHTQSQITRDTGAVVALNTAEIRLTVPAAWVAKGCEIFTCFNVKDLAILPLD
ncbi:hypothetical protein H1R20_g7345, partial [Candolleomyces eurysporus]